MALVESTSHQRFRSRLEYLEQHGQLIDASLELMRKQLGRTKADRIPAALSIEASKYTRLDHPCSTSSRLVNYSKARMAHHAIVELFRYFTEYLHSIVEEMYKEKPLDIVGKASQVHSLQFAEIIKMLTDGTLHQHMIDTTFRSLENKRSTTDLLERILKDTGVVLDETNRVTALAYLEMRHLIIHHSGKADLHYAKAYGSLVGVAAGDELPSTFETVSTALASVRAMVASIDTQLLDAGLLKKRK